MNARGKIVDRYSKVQTGSFRFDQFVLDPADRSLSRDGHAVELNARYFDALVLLVREQGKLVSKDRFLDEVWRGVPVTDEALTQCIRTLRQRLGDDVSKPRFIETVPKHGYRFVAPVECAAEGNRRAEDPHEHEWHELMSLGLAGTLGGGVAGVLGGLVYGLAGASQAAQPAVGAISIVAVVLCITTIVALVGAAGVSFGIASAAFLGRGAGPLLVAGGAFGGFLVGAVVKLLGMDAFSLLIGWTPGDITGPGEGLVLGAGVGVGVWAATSPGREASLRNIVAAGGSAGACAGLLIAAAGGHLMGGSLQLLAHNSPASRLRLDELGRIFGERGFGPVTQTVTCALEGMIFAACIIGAMRETRILRTGDHRRRRSATAGTSRA